MTLIPFVTPDVLTRCFGFVSFVQETLALLTSFDWREHGMSPISSPLPISSILF